MGVLSQVRQGRTLMAASAALVAAVSVTACEPRDGGGVSSISVAVTTDRMASRALEKGGIGVRWLTCTADLRSGRTAGASASGDSRRTGRTDARVDCHGRTENDKDIKVTGRVTYVRENHCVRGDLTGEVEGRKVFGAKVIGECDGGDRESERPRPTRSRPWEHRSSAGGGTQGK